MVQVLRHPRPHRHLLAVAVALERTIATTRPGPLHAVARQIKVRARHRQALGVGQDHRQVLLRQRPPVPKLPEAT